MAGLQLPQTSLHTHKLRGGRTYRGEVVTQTLEKDRLTQYNNQHTIPQKCTKIPSMCIHIYMYIHAVIFKENKLPQVGLRWWDSNIQHTVF